MVPGAPDDAPELRKVTVDHLLAAGAVVAGVLFVFRGSIDRQLSRLHAPGEESYSYSDLHESELVDAFAAWARGKEQLAAFEPVAARDLVLLRSAVVMASIVVTALVLHTLLRRLGRRLAPTLFLALFVATSGLVVLFDLSLVSDLTVTSNPYEDWFPWLSWLPLVFLALLAPYGVLPLWRAVRNRYATYRAAPASARLALGASAGFLALSNLGAIGAQLEDLLRRFLTAEDGRGEVGPTLLLLAAVAAYGLVLRLLATLVPRPGAAAEPGWLVRAGLGLTVVGAFLVYVAKQQSALLVLGLMVLGVGLLSWWAERALAPKNLARRDRVLLRIGIALAVAGVSMVVAGLRLGAEPHGALLGVGVITLLGGVALGFVASRSGRADAPLGSEGASVGVVLGIAVMAVAPGKVIALHAGLAVAVAAIAVLLSARQWFRTRVHGLDLLALAAVGIGVGIVRAGPEEWPLGGAIAVAGLVALRLNGGAFVALPWMQPEWPADPEPGPGPASEGDATRVLVLAALLPIGGLLVTSVRVLGGVLATGGEPPRVLLFFLGALVALLPLLGWAITRAANRALDPVAGPGLRRRATIVLGAASASLPLLALASLPMGSDVATCIGTALGPSVLIFVVLAWVAAVAGCVRRATKRLDPPPIFAQLGYERTPMLGLLVTWLVLIMVVGSPVEPDDVTSHDVRLLLTPASRLDPPPCADEHGVLAALDDADHDTDAPVAQELCRWLDAVLALPAVSSAAPDAPVPLILTSASGGGVRAAAWTTRVLDCLLFTSTRKPVGDTEAFDTSCPEAAARGLPRANRWPFVFAAGGTSGGSVGVATAAAEWLAPVPNDAPGPAQRPDQLWARDIAQVEHIGPVVGQLLVGELGLAAVGLVPEHDRAEVLIDDWSEPFGTVSPDRCPALANLAIEDVGFLEARAQCPTGMPLLLFNGTIVRTGGRFDISPLDDPNPDDGSLGLRDVLCRLPAEESESQGLGQDVPFFDAAFMSARFPLVTPSGRLGHDRPDGCRADAPSPVDIVDGGYYENSGTAQIAELWRELQPLIDALNDLEPRVVPEIRPVFLQIENGEAGADDVARDCMPNEARDPDAPDATTAPTPEDDDDHAVRIGEPLRVAWAGWQSRIRGEPESVRNELIAAMCAENVPVFTMALYEHPGRALPLGWSLTDDVLDDLEQVFALEPNVCRARAFVAYVDGSGPAPLAEPSCPPDAPPGEAG